MVKNPPAMQVSRVRSLAREDSPGEGNGNPLQYSCLRNPMDRGARWAMIHGLTRVRHDLATKPTPRVYMKYESRGDRKISSEVGNHSSGETPGTEGYGKISGVRSR